MHQTRLRVTRMLCMIMITALMVPLFSGCGSKGNSDASKGQSTTDGQQQEQKAADDKEKDKKDPVTLKFPIWSTITEDLFTKLDLVNEYKKDHPNVTIELELLKDTEYENTLKIRNAANELPDIMPLKSAWLVNFKDNILPLDDLEAAKNNLFAADFKVNDQILGVPESQFNEFVWYHKSVFQEYGIEIPKTWGEFVAAAKKIKDGGKYIPIAMGGKDAWPDYPFNEFMPSLVAGDGDYWSTMATMDEPFTKGQAFYDAYVKIQELYDAKVMGPDPLGVGFDQSKLMFASKQAGMIALGQWFGSDLKSMPDVDMNDIGAFLLPVRDSVDQPFNTVSMVDTFYTIPKTSKHPEEAKEFLNWFFSDKWYSKYMTEAQLQSTIKDVKIDLGTTFNGAFDIPNLNYVLNKGGNEDYKKIESAIKFDVKKMGQDMMAGKDFNKMMQDMNKSWKNARSKLK
ncbi:extracellular solute-binding protein [Paenibacillus sp. KQZ6P-2]|uniref:Extracellular solute-binding protein n=1 Tax=Paenibacillus mangrovi TaxID=2931978 RepID=A0A9X2B0A6_9BACL|nr:extracellular solute-binding protein [Paenibacillus mangrovi]MCJ8010304.1 extracellular solute-binding protein [Paenibacillus mangrovi]